MDVIVIILVYLIFMNSAGFILMGLDKWKARKRTFRIPEATLFILAIIGGSLGSTIGMHVFRHKTRHWYFVYGMPLILFLQLIILYLLYRSPLNFAIL